MKNYRLKAGIVVKIGGIPVQVAEDVVVRTATDLDLVLGRPVCSTGKCRSTRRQLQGVERLPDNYFAGKPVRLAEPYFAEQDSATCCGETGGSPPPGPIQVGGSRVPP